MTAVTRTYYTNRINTMRSYSVNRTPQNNATDDARALADATLSRTTGAPATLPTMTAGEIPGSGASPVIGTDVRDLMRAYAYEWSQVRRIKYELTGNVSPAGSSYIKYAWIKTPEQTSSVPGVGNAMFAPLNTGEDIDLAAFNSIIATLNTLIKADVDDLDPDVVYYCHSNCHSSCHNSRGRR